jgi:S1-C subfamily serine protease
MNAPAAEERPENPDAASIGTTVIPSAVIPSAQEQAIQPASVIAPESSQIVNYEANQQMPLNEPQLHSLQEFMNEGVNTSPLGVELQEGARRGKNGREVDGLLVVALQPGSPAERAGVMAGHRQAHDVVEGVAVAASLVFPPAVLVVPVIETIQLGENYDLIIGVDGNRVTNFMDFQDQLREAQPGETVYLNILRGGKRLQLPVEMPKPNPSKLSP